MKNAIKNSKTHLFPDKKIQKTIKNQEIQKNIKKLQNAKKKVLDKYENDYRAKSIQHLHRKFLLKLTTHMVRISALDQ